MVVGGSLAAAPASALELGEIKVHSTIGQPLRASIAYAVAPNEVIEGTCVSVQSGHGGVVPSVNSGTVTIAGGVISITGESIVREPVVTLRVNVRCPYTPRLPTRSRRLSPNVSRPHRNSWPRRYGVPRPHLSAVSPSRRRPVISYNRATRCHKLHNVSKARPATGVTPPTRSSRPTRTRS